MSELKINITLRLILTINLKISTFLEILTSGLTTSSVKGTPKETLSIPGLQTLSATSNGNFRMNMFNYNLGFDWFLDDFNTITLQGNYRKFDFNNANKAFNSSVITGQPDQNYLRVSEGGRDFANQNYSLNYKRSFTDKNKELSADFTWSRNNATLDGFQSLTHITICHFRKLRMSQITNSLSLSARLIGQCRCLITLQRWKPGWKQLFAKWERDFILQ